MIVKRVLAGRELPVPADEGNNGYFLHEVSPQYAAAQHHERYSDEEIFIPERDDKEPARVLRKLFRDGAGQWRELTVMTPTIEKDDLRESILRWMVCLYLVLLMMILLVTVIVLYRTMRPLYALLRWLDGYTVGARNAPLAVETSVTAVSYTHLDVYKRQVGSLFFRIDPHFDRGARPLVDLPLFGAQAASGIGDPHLDPEGPGRVDFVVRGQRVGNYI